MNQIVFKERESGKEIIEDVPGGGFLKFLYQNPLGKASLWILVKRKVFSTLFGKYMSSSRSKKKIAPFVEQHQIDLNEYLVPEGGYKHFNDFFYRHIQPDKRPIGEHVVSPADGRVVAFQEMKDVTTFYVKGSEFNISTFLNDSSLAEKFKGGSLMVVRLAPVDYHRYHFPVSGTAGKNVKIPGAYYSVSPFALLGKIRIFCENKREYCVVQSHHNGDVLICDVGATLTGGITQTYQENTIVEKGSEKGYFSFGGSTLILLFEKGRVNFDADLIENTQNGFETYVKMGEKIGV